MTEKKIKKVKVTWYEGDIVANDPVKVLNEKIIDHVDHIMCCDWMSVLPNSVRLQSVDDIRYYRYIELIPEKKYTIDYGSHCLFVLIEEIE